MDRYAWDACLAGDSSEERHIPAHGRSCCRRNKVAVFISTITDVWDGNLEAPRCRRTVTSVRLQIRRGPAKCVPSEMEGRCVCRRQRTEHVSAVISAMPSAIGSSHSSPVSSPAASCCASAPGTSRALWPERRDEEGTFGPLVVYTSPVNVFYFYLLGV